MLPLLFVLILLFPGYSWGHYEDLSGCTDTFTHLPKKEWTVLYHGISEDKRDYLYRLQHRTGPLVIEVHHVLLPVSRWGTPPVPKYMPAILSVWIDYDGDGHFGEWYLFPRGQADCADAIHFIWDVSLQTYRLATK